MGTPNLRQNYLAVYDWNIGSKIFLFWKYRCKSLIYQAEAAPSAPAGSGEAEEGKEEAITFSPMAEEVGDFVI